MYATQSLRARLHALLVLGRVSNLPTVWSNCLAAWLLGGGGSGRRFTVLCIGATLLYTGGMFLNDAFDESFDRQYRPERPIPAGHFSARTVWVLALATLTLGWLVLLPLGILPAAWAAVLVGTIATYDAVHKRTVLAPLLMAACRFLLYLVAASSAPHGIGTAVTLRASALAAYIVGISYLARGESESGTAPPWSLGFLFVPATFSVMMGPKTEVLFVAAISVLWIAWNLRGPWLSPKGSLSSGVAGLLAGIVLVDWQAAMTQGGIIWVSFGGLFLLALVMQRMAPAT